ncbi:MAG: hypothetical protein GY703_06910 [Gammaproteobacteria bacterium]|nr:hypothetical protein [Gammaproteobacteria bacterium]
MLHVAGHTLSGDHTPSLPEYAEELKRKGILPVVGPSVSSHGAGPVESVLEGSWQSLDKRPAGPRALLKLLSILPRNESIPFELLCVMVDAGNEASDETTNIALIRQAAVELSTIGLAEQIEENSVKIHPVFHEFTADRAKQETKAFVEATLTITTENLHAREFCRNRNERDLIRCGERLRLLRLCS